LLYKSHFTRIFYLVSDMSRAALVATPGAGPVDPRYRNLVQVTTGPFDMRVWVRDTKQVPRRLSGGGLTRDFVFS